MTNLALRLRLTWQSGFLRSVGTLMGGNAIATAVPILAAPVLGRLYMPSDYGALAQYMAPAAVLAVLASLQFQHAIIAERTDRGASQAAWLVLLSSLIIGALTALVVAAFWRLLFAGTAAGAWFALLPLSVASGGVIIAGQSIANRTRRYRFAATVQVAHVLATVVLSIALGFLQWGANGLLAAYFLGQISQLVVWGWLIAGSQVRLGRWPGSTRLRVLMRRHWKFLAFTLPSGFASQINMQAPIFALSALGADATLGAFTRARQLVSMPATVVGSSVAQVFRREASEVYRETGSCRALMLRTAGWLLVMGISPCLVFMAFAPWMFAVYLGPDWREAGEIARILAPMLLLRVMVSPLTTVFYFTCNQAMDLYLMLGSVVLMALAIMLGWVFGGTAMAVIWGFTLGYGAIYLMYMFATFTVARS